MEHSNNLGRFRFPCSGRQRCSVTFRLVKRSRMPPKDKDSITVACTIALEQAFAFAIAVDIAQ